MNRGQRRAQWRARRAGGDGARSLVATSDPNSHPAGATQPGALPNLAPPSFGGASSAPMAINLRVGELALRGFEASHGRRIADALQHSLTAMLSSQGIPDAWSRSSRAGRTNGGKLQLTTGAAPRAIGEELARRVLTVRTDERS